MLSLVADNVEMSSLAADFGIEVNGSAWGPEGRPLVRAELDAAFFHLYGISRDDADYIMGTFPIARRKDEAAHGEYRTKRLILEAYDRLAG